MTALANKKNETLLKLEELVKAHNELVEQKAKLYNQIIGLQGALNALNELDVDQPTDTETT